MSCEKNWILVGLLMIGGCGNGRGSGSDFGAPADLGGADSSAGCPTDVPAACPSPAPSWDGGVVQIIAAKCVPCHNPSGVAYDTLLNDYAAVYAKRAKVQTQLTSCYMPPPGAAAIDPGDRQTLLGWLVCGAPNN